MDETQESALFQHEGLIGATSQDEMPISTSPGELDMIVWLRGDEPYAHEFSIDAEGAMQTLGIKRSRLTQISGKELRVGRIRVNRYIRPMYRPEDLEAYKHWTRATATHLRASSVISDAASKLEDHAQHLSENMFTAVSGFTASFEQSMANFQAELSANQQAVMQMTENLVGSIKLETVERISKQQDDFKNRLDEFSFNLDAQTRKIEDLATLETANQNLFLEFTTFKGDMEKGLLTMAEAIAKIQTSLDNQTSFSRDMGKALGMILQFQRELLKKQDEQFILLKETNTKIAQPPLPRIRRRVPGTFARRPHGEGNVASADEAFEHDINEFEQID